MHASPFQKSALFMIGSALVLGSSLMAQGGPGDRGPGGRRGPGGQGGPGGPGGPNAPDVELVKKYDLDADGRLNREERNAARAELASVGSRRGGRRGRRGGPSRTGSPGEKVSPEGVESYAGKGVYAPEVLRTYFLEFEADDWEAELEAFKPTDVMVPATLTVDGEVFKDVGVSFRGASSFFMIPSGLKRSLNISFDFVHDNQALGGIRTLNLLNCNGDESMLSTVLYSKIARERIAAPRANYAKIVINGESWGIYSNVEQFNKDFLKKNFSSGKGARWKVSGSPRGDGGLRYLGEDIEPYRERFDIKSKDREADWRALIHLCKILGQTPEKEIEKALAPILDVDGALWFLAVDIALVNSDGYWTRASDYSLYLDPEGMFHILPHDMNEALGTAHGGRRGGRGGRGGDRRRGGESGGPPGGGPGGGESYELDPLLGLDDEAKPLRSRLLANKKLNSRYLQHIRAIASENLNWEFIGPQVESARAMLMKEVEKDTRKLGSLEGFLKKTDPTDLADALTRPEAAPIKEPNEDGNGAPEPAIDSLRTFATKRAAYLLGLEGMKSLPKEPISIIRAEKRDVEAARLDRMKRIDSPLVISEVMAANRDSIADANGDYDDWIEIHNTSDQRMELAGYYLSDDPDELDKWAFPEKTHIDAGGYLVVWADKDKQPGLHASFKLAREGESVFLSRKAGIVSKLTYPVQSWGDSFGWAGEKAIAMQPTPGLANQAHDIGK